MPFVMPEHFIQLFVSLYFIGLMFRALNVQICTAECTSIDQSLRTLLSILTVYLNSPCPNQKHSLHHGVNISNQVNSGCQQLTILVTHLNVDCCTFRCLEPSYIKQTRLDYGCFGPQLDGKWIQSNKLTATMHVAPIIPGVLLRTGKGQLAAHKTVEKEAKVIYFFN